MEWVAAFVILCIASWSLPLLQINRTVDDVWFIIIILILISTEVRSESLWIMSFLYYIADSFFHGFVYVKGVLFNNCSYVLIFDLLNFDLFWKLVNKDSVPLKGAVGSRSRPAFLSRLSLWICCYGDLLLLLAIFCSGRLVVFLNTDLIWIGVLRHHCCEHGLLVESGLTRAVWARCYDFEHRRICSGFLSTFLRYGPGYRVDLLQLTLWLLALHCLRVLW